MAEVVKFIQVIFLNRRLCKLMMQMRTHTSFLSLRTDIAHVVPFTLEAGNCLLMADGE